MEHTMNLVSWPQFLIYGMMVTGLLVGVWEWDDFVFRRGWTRSSRLLLSVGTPIILGVAKYFGHLEMPLGIFVVILIAQWYLVTDFKWRMLGSVMILVAVFARPVFIGDSVHALIDVIIMAVLIMVLVGARSRLNEFGVRILLYVSLTAGAVASMIVNRDAVADLWVSITVASLTFTYIMSWTDRTQRWQHDIYRAEHDALTGSLTRYGHVAWLTQSEMRGRAEGLVVACDVDDFKWFNDTWGHDLGDQVLHAIATRLQAEIRSQDALVRPGGDEFTVWIPEATSANAEDIVERLHRSVTEHPYSFSVGTFRLGVSMGWAVGPFSGDTAQKADQNLLEAKRQGKNRVARDAPGRVSTIPPDWPDSTANLKWLADATTALWSVWNTAAVLANADGSIVAVNQAYERLTGRSSHELIGQKPGVMSGDDTPDELWQTLREKKPWHGKLKNSRPDGTIWWAQESIIPIVVGTQIVGYWRILQECAPDVQPNFSSDAGLLSPGHG
ncbi:MAG: diguanylate cyclase [Firmicutes bacterium]|uniref:GGDEF domain-containing protein n=1 Tax=Sulfobacillus benefaciens TaxID=453960 RepID=A0A2T2WY27_9FIRM|nr:diguanylate cyclase [Bacillota bacterium]MCL5015304.1 diguanylate cyclase [Bacillota bacterium]PSR27134.1 MAG: hypothetical protein C7B43_12450 [Sulfobacillus benefaciens]